MSKQLDILHGFHSRDQSVDALLQAVTSKSRDDDGAPSARARGPREGDACVRTPYIDPTDVIYVV